MLRTLAVQVLLSLIGLPSLAQLPALDRAVKKFQADAQNKHAVVGFVVIDTGTGKTVYGHNQQYGLVPASALKVVTAIAAFDVLGASFQHQTGVELQGSIKNGLLEGNIVINGVGDPSLASWRYASHPKEMFVDSLAHYLDRAGVKEVSGGILLKEQGVWGTQTIPPGWTWEDMGNYYGAGIGSLNWNENQYDVVLTPGVPGAAVKIKETKPALKHITLISELVTGAAGSGDQAYIFLPPYASKGFIRGSVPAGKSFQISGSVPEPTSNALFQIEESLKKKGIAVHNKSVQAGDNRKSLYIYTSPTLDSLVYWFLHKSINLYGEAFVRQIALKQAGKAEAETGVSTISNYWKNNGITDAELKMRDGSGLSPSNRVTAQALAKAMVYARKRPWYNSFYAALPSFNNTKMKSGTIGGVKSFVGYKGKFAFAIVVNNYNGSTSSLVQKMYKVIDEIK